MVAVPPTTPTTGAPALQQPTIWDTYLGSLDADSKHQSRFLFVVAAIFLVSSNLVHMASGASYSSNEPFYKLPEVYVILGILGLCALGAAIAGAKRTVARVPMYQYGLLAIMLALQMLAAGRHYLVDDYSHSVFALFEFIVLMQISGAVLHGVGNRTPVLLILAWVINAAWHVVVVRIRCPAIWDRAAWMAIGIVTVESIALRMRIQSSWAEFVARKRMQLEAFRAEEMLSIAMPKRIAHALMLGKRTVETHNCATVAFIYIDGFKTLVLDSKTSEKELFNDLNVFMCRMDELILSHKSVLKIESVQNCYMVASGIMSKAESGSQTPGAGEAHARAVIDFCLDVLRMRTQLRRTFNLLIGVNAGAVTSGVIGKSRTFYRLFGDTVNVASRMATTSQSNRLQLSAAAHSLLSEGHGYNITSRGQTEVKGKGLMHTYFVDLLGQVRPSAKAGSLLQKLLVAASKSSAADRNVAAEAVSRLAQKVAHSVHNLHSTFPTEAETKFKSMPDPTANVHSEFLHTLENAYLQQSKKAVVDAADDRKGRFRFSMSRGSIGMSSRLGIGRAAVSPSGPYAVDMGFISRPLIRNARPCQKTWKGKARDRVLSCKRALEVAFRRVAPRQIRLDTGREQIYNEICQLDTLRLLRPGVWVKHLFTVFLFAFQIEDTTELGRATLFALTIGDIVLTTLLMQHFLYSYTKLTASFSEDPHQAAMRLNAAGEASTSRKRPSIASVSRRTSLSIFQEESDSDSSDDTDAKKTKGKSNCCRRHNLNPLSLLNGGHFAEWATVIVVSFGMLTMTMIDATTISLNIETQRDPNNQVTCGALVLTPALVVAMASLFIPTFRIHMVMQILSIGGMWLALGATSTFLQPSVQCFPVTRMLPFHPFVVFIALLSMFLSRNREHVLRRALVLAAAARQATQQADEVLNNLFPPSVTRALKDRVDMTGELTSDDAVLLWADMKGFTALSSTLSPIHMQMLLDRIYSEFDIVVEQCGLFKMDTIGDAYVAVAFISAFKQETGAGMMTKVFSLAQQMQKHMKQLADTEQLDISLRVGIHAGPVVAGIMGRLRPRYHVYGETVILAEEMESSGKPGYIQVSEAAAKLYYDQVFQLYPRSMVPSPRILDDLAAGSDEPRLIPMHPHTVSKTQPLATSSSGSSNSFASSPTKGQGEAASGRPPLHAATHSRQESTDEMSNTIDENVSESGDSADEDNPSLSGSLLPEIPGAVPTSDITPSTSRAFDPTSDLSPTASMNDVTKLCLSRELFKPAGSSSRGLVRKFTHMLLQQSQEGTSQVQLRAETFWLMASKDTSPELPTLSDDVA